MACMGEMRNAYKILAGKHEGKCPLQRYCCRLEVLLKFIYNRV
jgi:hypothetical protein